jgi:hypothetical protein
VDIFERLSGMGHLMPGFTSTNADGTEVLVWEMPSQQEINDQDTPFLRACFHLFKLFKSCGLPHGSGFMNERKTVIDIIVLLESEESKYESWWYKNRDHLEEKD